MLYRGRNMNFWQCPACDTEVWPREAIGIVDRDIAEAYGEDVRRPVPRKSRSSRRSKRFGARKVRAPLEWRYVLGR
jgi:hypothetical protein